MVVDHVVQLVADAARAEQQLRDEFGLGLVRGPYQPFAGTRNHTVPLHFPQYLEVLTIEEREVAMATPDGQAVLTCERRGFGVFSWSVLVNDLEAVSSRVGIAIHDSTIPHGDGTLRGWRTVGDRVDLPYFIDYPNNGDRAGRYRALYDRAGHTCAPIEFVDVAVGGSRDELAEWLGPHALPVSYVGGPPGIRAATIRTAEGSITIT